MDFDEVVNLRAEMWKVPSRVRIIGFDEVEILSAKLGKVLVL